MNLDKGREVVAEYRMLLQHVPKAKGPVDKNPSQSEAIGHLHLMLDQMDEMLDRYAQDFEPQMSQFWDDAEGQAEWEKFNRWLGFVQGVFWLHGDFTLDQMRGHNRT